MKTAFTLVAILGLSAVQAAVPAIADATLSGVSLSAYKHLDRMPAARPATTQTILSGIPMRQAARLLVEETGRAKSGDTYATAAPTGVPLAPAKRL